MPASSDADDEVTAIRQTAGRLLARREYAVRELHQRLLGRDFDAAQVAQVIAELQRENLLSDERFAESFVHARVARGDGPLKLRAALYERGVDDTLVARFVPDDYASWAERMEAVRARRFGARRPQAYREWARQARFLQQRGFSAEHIRRLLREDEMDQSGIGDA